MPPTRWRKVAQLWVHVGVGVQQSPKRTEKQTNFSYTSNSIPFERNLFPGLPITHLTFLLFVHQYQQREITKPNKERRIHQLNKAISSVHDDYHHQNCCFARFLSSPLLHFPPPHHLSWDLPRTLVTSFLFPFLFLPFFLKMCVFLSVLCSTAKLVYHLPFIPCCTFSVRIRCGESMSSTF